MIKEGDLPILDQIVKRLEASFLKLKQAYARTDSEEFNRAKKEIIWAQKKILEVIR